MKTRDHQTDTWRAPPVPEGEILLYDEPGRVLEREGDSAVCYRSYHFRVTSREGAGAWGATLFVRHGGGVERFRLPGPHLGRRVSWSDLPPDVQRFARQSFPEYAP